MNYCGELDVLSSVYVYVYAEYVCSMWDQDMNFVISGFPDLYHVSGDQSSESSTRDKCSRTLNELRSG